jgi:hypothetical protein
MGDIKAVFTFFDIFFVIFAKLPLSVKLDNSDAVQFFSANGTGYVLSLMALVFSS